MLTLETVLVDHGDWTLEADIAVPGKGTTAIIGPSGAGKSTLLNVVAGFQPVMRGRVLWQGRDITALPPAKRPIALIFQDNNLFPHLTAAQNVALAITHKTRLTKDEADQIARALARVGLKGFDHRKPGQLSGGQQSRVALARVLLQRKPLILLDEPFSALGPAMRAEMLDLVAELAGELGAAVLMVSHDPNDARRIAAQTIAVIAGQAQAPRPTAELLDSPPPDLAAYLGV